MPKEVFTPTDKRRVKAAVAATTLALGLTFSGAINDKPPETSPFEQAQIEDIREKVDNLEPGQHVVSVTAGEKDSPWQIVSRVQEATGLNGDPRPEVDRISESLGENKLQPTELVQIDLNNLK